MDITKEIIKYIENNSLSIDVIARATGVNIHLLKKDGKRKLNATELLVICNYLDVDPKSLI